MPSFDIVSKIDMSELKNAVSNSMKEISQRYDFKGSISNIELENDFLIVHTEDDLKAKQVNDILNETDKMINNLNSDREFKINEKTRIDSNLENMRSKDSELKTFP